MKSIWPFSSSLLHMENRSEMENTHTSYSKKMPQKQRNQYIIALYILPTIYQCREFTTPCLFTHLKLSQKTYCLQYWLLQMKPFLRGRASVIYQGLMQLSPQRPADFTQFFTELQTHRESRLHFTENHSNQYSMGHLGVSCHHLAQILSLPL